MKITDILVDNFVTLSLVIGMAVLVTTNKTFDRRTNRYFAWFIFLVLALDLADMADYYMTGFSSPVIWRYFSSALGYTLRPATLAIIINIVLRRKRFNIAIWSLIILEAVIAFSSYFTHLMFWFDANNDFVRGVLGYSSHIISGIYMLLLVVLTAHMQRFIDRGEILAVYYIGLVCVLATVIESAFPVKFLLPGAMIASCALYYIYLYVQTYNRDVLTGLLNRRSFYADAAKLRHQSMAVVSMDLNGLKDINDTKGHNAGDEALRVLAETAVTLAGHSFFVYRTGGDEFMALGKGRSAEQTEAYISTLREALGKTNYMASIGYAMYKPDDSFDEVCNRADAQMYSDKKTYKHRLSPREQ